MKSIMKLIYYDDENDEIEIKDKDDYLMFLNEGEKIFLKIP